MMKILIACEFSGVVREAFRRRGHDVWSCDILETEIPGQHIRGDVRDVLGFGWDMMIAHPPCRHLAVSGARWFAKKADEQAEALEFVRYLLDAPIEKIALENPVGVISTKIRKPDQIVHPYYFGHPEKKRTCWWLKNLPALKPTKMLDTPERGYWDNQTPSGQSNTPETSDRWKIRSRTLYGVAEALAEQWT